MEKSKTIKTPISKLPSQTLIKIKKSNHKKQPLKVSNFIDNNLDKDFLNNYFQESKK
tara:strand:- start:6588 stop:6758 length:171 start_codon:yes stop_codon:yes gene_type:complete